MLIKSGNTLYQALYTLNNDNSINYDQLSSLQQSTNV